MVEQQIPCEFCETIQYGYDGLERHLTRGWCKKHDKFSADEIRNYIGGRISAYLQAKEVEYQQDEEYDRRHNLGAYSY